MKLIRLTTTNQNLEFNSFFNEDINIEPNSKIALSNLCYEKLEEDIIINDDNNKIQYNNGGNTYDIFLENGIYDSVNLHLFLEDFSKKLNSSLRTSEGVDIGCSMLVYINANDKIRIASDYSTQLNPLNRFTSVRVSISNPNDIGKNTTTLQWNSNMGSNLMEMYNGLNGCGIFSMQLSQLALTGEGVYIGLTDTQPKDMNGDFSPVNCVYAIQAPNIGTGQNHILTTSLNVSGTGYNVDDTGDFTGGSGTGASYEIDEVDDSGVEGSILTNTISVVGSNYSVDDVGNLTGGTGNDATYKVLTTTNGKIETSSLTNGGTTYNVGDTGSLAGGVGVGAEYRVDTITAGGIVSTYSITNVGVGYIVGNILTLDGSGSSDCSITVSSVINGMIATISIVNAGSNYSPTDTLTLSSNGDNLAQIVVGTVDNTGEILKYRIIDEGINYVSGDVLTFSGRGDGTATLNVDTVSTTATNTYKFKNPSTGGVLVNSTTIIENANTTFNNNDILRIESSEGQIKFMIYNDSNPNGVLLGGSNPITYPSDNPLYPIIGFYQMANTGIKNISITAKFDSTSDSIESSPVYTSDLNLINQDINKYDKFIKFENIDLSLKLGFLTQNLEANISELNFKAVSSISFFNKDNSFIVMLDNIQLNSYDDFDKNNLQKGGRKNILSVIADEVPEKMMVYEPRTQYFIDINNPEPLILRNFKMRVLKNNFDKVEAINLSTLTILIKSPNE